MMYIENLYEGTRELEKGVSKVEWENGLQTRSGSSVDRLIISFKAVVSRAAFWYCLLYRRALFARIMNSLRKKEEKRRSKGCRPLPVSSQIPASAKLNDPAVVECFRTHLRASRLHSKIRVSVVLKVDFQFRNRGHE